MFGDLFGGVSGGRMTAIHPAHDRVAAEIRSWYISSAPAIGMIMQEGREGYFTGAASTVGPRVILTVDDPADLAGALEVMDERYRGAAVDVWVDDRLRAERLAPGLLSAGCEPHPPTEYLALVGQVPVEAAPAGLEISGAGGRDLEAWCRVKLQGFADSEDEPQPEQLQAEMAARRAEEPIARLQLARMGDQPVAVLSHYVGAVQLVFNLATRLPWRHRGIARAMLAGWAAAGQAEGCLALAINCDEGGRPAALYRRLGFVDQVYWHQRWRRPARA